MTKSQLDAKSKKYILQTEDFRASARKETVGISILMRSRNGDKIMQFRSTRKGTQFSQLKWAFSKVKPIERFKRATIRWWAIDHKNYDQQPFILLYVAYPTYASTNGTRTHNHLVRMRALNHVAKHQIRHLLRARSSGVPCHSGNYRVCIDSEMRTWHDHDI